MVGAGPGDRGTWGGRPSAVSETPRYATLRDYLRVLRANRLLILLCALVFAAAGFAFSATKERIYESEATLSFRQQGIDLQLLAGTPAGSSTQDLRPALTAEFVHRDDVARPVKRRLKTKEPASRLKNAGNARGTTPTNFLVIDARWKDAAFAAKLANAYGQTVQSVVARQQRALFRSAARSLRRRLRALKLKNPITRASFEDRISRLDALAGFSSPLQRV